MTTLQSFCQVCTKFYEIKLRFLLSFLSFTANTYSFTVDTSDLDLGIVIGQVKAQDADAGINGIVRYRIRTSEDPEGAFSFFGIDAATGHIRIKKLPLTKRK
mgnify:CR=1 FL=1